jgi:hypothetical protein
MRIPQCLPDEGISRVVSNCRPRLILNGILQKLRSFLKAKPSTKAGVMDGGRVVAS